MERVITEKRATFLLKSRSVRLKKKIKNKINKIKFKMRAVWTEEPNNKYKGMGSIAIRGALVGKIVVVFERKGTTPPLINVWCKTSDASKYCA